MTIKIHRKELHFEMNNYKGITYAILSSAAFGIMPVLARIAYANGSNASTVLIFRFLISSIILFLYLKYTHVNVNIKKEQALLLLLIGITGYTITAQALFISYNYLGAGLSTTLHFIYPVAVCIIEFVFFKSKMSTKKIVSLILAALGICSLVALKKSTVNVLGVSLALFSGVAYALTMISLNLNSIKNLDNRIVTLYLCIGSTMGMLLYGLFTGSITLNFNFKILSCYLGISIISTIVSIILLLKAIKIIGVSSASILGTFEPMVSIFLGILFLGEKLSLTLLIGSILIIISTIILAKDKCAAAN